MKKTFNQGVTLVEVLIAASIITAFLTALLGTHSFYLKTAFSNRHVIKAAQLAEEGIEVVRFERDSSWTLNIETLDLDTEYRISFESGDWVLSETPVFIDNLFDRTVTLSSVSRDGSNDIVTSGGTLDPDTLLVTSSVSWVSNGATTTREVYTYITNLFDN